MLEDPRTVTGGTTRCEPFANFFSLADKFLLDKAAKTDAVDGFLKARGRGWNWFEDWEAINKIFTQPTRERPLRKPMVDIVSRDVTRYVSVTRCGLRSV